MIYKLWYTIYNIINCLLKYPASNSEHVLYCSIDQRLALVVWLCAAFLHVFVWRDTQSFCNNNQFALTYFSINGGRRGSCARRWDRCSTLLRVHKHKSHCKLDQTFSTLSHLPTLASAPFTTIHHIFDSGWEVRPVLHTWESDQGHVHSIVNYKERIFCADTTALAAFFWIIIEAELYLTSAFWFDMILQGRLVIDVVFLHWLANSQS